MQITITSGGKSVTKSFPDIYDLRIVSKFCLQNNYQEEVLEEGGKMIPNPETKAQFFFKKIMGYIKENVKEQEAAEAIEAGKFSAIAKAESEINIT